MLEMLAVSDMVVGLQDLAKKTKQTYMADQCGLKYGTLNRLIRGKTPRPTAETAVKVTKFLQEQGYPWTKQDKG